MCLSVLPTRAVSSSSFKVLFALRFVRLIILSINFDRLFNLTKHFANQTKLNSSELLVSPAVVKLLTHQACLLTCYSLQHSERRFVSFVER